MSGFAADWLRQREPFDAAARDPDLARRFGAALSHRQNKARRIVDLAAGSGANFRALAPLVGGDQDWLLVDHDPSLIAAQAAEIARWSKREGWHCEEFDGGLLVQTGAARWQVRAQQLNLAQLLEQVEFAACDGVTTAAFLDLVSPAWLERLCGLLTRRSLPLLATLTVDGRRRWQPPLPADQHMNNAFLRHQSTDKGFGCAVGNRATTYLAECLALQGYEVNTANSDWRIGVEHREMLRQMVEEAAAVARETEPAASTLIDGWLSGRNAQIESGLLALDIGHKDLLAVAAS
jgi:hypothetical protein